MVDWTLENVTKLGPDALVIVEALLPLAKEAKDAAEMIRKVYRFGIGEDTIEVYRDGCNHEYLTHGGVWQARYIHQTYDVECSADSIFEYFKAEYLVENGFAKECEDHRQTKEGEMKQICGYLRGFINSTRKSYSIMQAGPKV